MNSSKHEACRPDDPMREYKICIWTEPCIKVTTHLNIIHFLHHDQSPNLSTKLRRQSFESGNYVLMVNAAGYVTLWRHTLFDHWQTTFQRLVWTVLLKRTSRHCHQGLMLVLRDLRIYTHIKNQCCMLSVEVTNGRTAGCINTEYIGFPFESRRIPAAFVTPAGGACDTISWVSRLRSQTLDNTIPIVQIMYIQNDGLSVDPLIISPRLRNF